MKILIFQDYVHNNGALYRALSRQFGTDNVHYADATDIAGGGALASGVKLFVMPGGADLYYAEKLNGAGNRAIRAYVENGGVYLGICAGAYYACESIDWARGTAQDIHGPRELAFFPGRGIGPVTDFIEDGDIARSWHAAPEILYDDGTYKMEARVHYAGGPHFVPAREDGFKILARYENGLNAIVECPFGAGKAILCGPHIEKTYDDITRGLYRHENKSYDWEKQAAEKLHSSETQARRLWAQILLRCVGTRKQAAA